MFIARRNGLRPMQVLKMSQRYSSKAPPKFIKDDTKKEEAKGAKGKDKSQAGKAEEKQVVEEFRAVEDEGVKKAAKVPVEDTNTKVKPQLMNQNQFTLKKYFTSNKPFKLKKMKTVEEKTEKADKVEKKENDVDIDEPSLLDYRFEIEQYTPKSNQRILLSADDMDLVEDYQSSKVAFLEDYATLIKLGGSRSFSDAFTPPSIPVDARYNILTKEWNDEKTKNKNVKEAEKPCYIREHDGRGRRRVVNISAYFKK